jgi:hypothetical protein
MIISIHFSESKVQSWPRHDYKALITTRLMAPNTPPRPRFKELALLVCKLALAPVFEAPPVASASAAGTTVTLVTVLTAPSANVVV